MYSKATPLEDHSHQSAQAPEKSKFWLLTLGCIGVVYGDIGTSPLYAFREAIKAASAGQGAILPADVYGVVSLILWALFLIVTSKYVLFLLHADNRGEGGILSLMALAQKGVSTPRGLYFVLSLGIAGASLFYGDSIITPAISVLSAVEGLELATPAFEHAVLPIAMIILVILFYAQKKGTAKVSIFFGPVTVIWFLAIGLTGVVWIFRNPHILASVNPYYAVSLLSEHFAISLSILGAVFLAVTGAEALYADLGHFGMKPIQTAWVILVLPCLTLNYIGQGALILEKPGAIENPFYLMVPDSMLLPMIALATAATIIASQAVITGAYSLTRQAIQLGLLPRLEIRHTSEEQEGQIYLPKVNRLLLLGVLLLCAAFHNSSALASAYGIAVTGTMIVTTVLVFVVIWRVWNKKILLAASIVLPFLVVEGVFLCANMLKVFDGGIVPLAMAAWLSLLMYIWVAGTRYLRRKDHRNSVPLIDLTEKLEREPPARVPGTAIFMTSEPQDAPIALMQNLKHNKVLHENNIVLTIINTELPRVPDEHRISVDRINSSMTRILVNYGYMETPDIPKVLQQARRYGVDIDINEASFFLGKRSIYSDPRRGLPEWQDHVYIALAKAAASATDFYRIPNDRVVELGIKISV